MLIIYVADSIVGAIETIRRVERRVPWHLARRRYFDTVMDASNAKRMRRARVRRATVDNRLVGAVCHTAVTGKRMATTARRAAVGGDQGESERVRKRLATTTRSFFGSASKRRACI